MTLNSQLAQALNQQINAELNASLNYLSMAAYFDSVALPGFATWFRAQSQEENEHGMRIYDFIVKRSGDVKITGIANPVQSFSAPVEALQAALEMEKAVTAQIHALFELAHEVKEYSTLTMLNWFLDEQIEEEDSFRTILEKVQAAGDDRWNMLELDKELGARSTAE